LQVTWTAVAGADEYEVYYGISTPSTLAVTTTGTTTTISGLSADTIYYVCIRAKNATGVSNYGATSRTVSCELYRGAEKIGDYNISTALSWISANAVSGNNFSIVLFANETISPKGLSYSNKIVGITISGSANERTISLSSNGRMFTVGSGVTLTLDQNITLIGRSTNNDSLVQVSSGGNLIINNGAKITGNTNTNTSSGGGGIYNGGTVTINGGKINGNTAAIGGGIYNSGTVTMNGGTISGNNSNSSSSNSGGGGIYVSYGYSFTMYGGIINGNTSNLDGGGVFTVSYTNYPEYPAIFIKLTPSGGGQNSGIIYGSEAVGVDADGIPLKNTSNNNRGHSVGSAVVGSNSSQNIYRYRNTIAGETVQIDTTTGKGLSANGNAPYGQ